MLIACTQIEEYPLISISTYFNLKRWIVQPTVLYVWLKFQLHPLKFFSYKNLSCSSNCGVPTTATFLPEVQTSPSRPEVFNWGWVGWLVRFYESLITTPGQTLPSFLPCSSPFVWSSIIIVFIADDWALCDNHGWYFSAVAPRFIILNEGLWLSSKGTGNYCLMSIELRIYFVKCHCLGAGHQNSGDVD